MLVASEHLVGDFKLVILCTDGDHQVVIRIDTGEVIEGFLSARALSLVEEWR